MSFRSPAESLLSPQVVASLLSTIQGHVADHAGRALDRALSDLDDYLFNRSEDGEETLGLVALRDMRRVRAEILQRFRRAISEGFRDLADAGMEVAQADDDVCLSLVSERDLEEQLAIQQLEVSVLRTHSQAFELANRRLSELLRHDEAGARRSPLAPSFLGRGLAAAMEPLSLDSDLRIVVFKFFERELGGALAEIYERSNAAMANAGILPGLRTHARPATPRRVVQQDDAAPVQANVMGEQHSVPVHQQQPQLQAADQVAFANMLGLLQQWRRSSSQESPPSAAAAPVLSTNDLLSVLSLMQQDSAPRFTPADAPEQQSLAAQLRQQMTHNARKLGIQGDNLTLDGLDDDAVDLVALLFDVLLDGPQFDMHIRQMIGRMLVPYVKVAVRDRRLFLLKEHPARRLLNTVAEACEGNRGEAPQERELLTRVDSTIDRLVAEFNEDVAIFEALEQELRSYMAQHRRRFELAEKRSAEAQRGQERLEQARRLVRDDLAVIRRDRPLPPVIDDFVSRHASHHLVQVALQDGRGSERYDGAMRVLEAVLGGCDLVAAEGRGDARELLPEQGMLDILASVGCVGEAAHAAVDAVVDAMNRLGSGDAAITDDARLPPAVPQAERTAKGRPELHVVAGTGALDFDAAMLGRLRTLKVGDWLLLVEADGGVAPAKVSWVSPISGRLLLVNRRGIRVLVASVEELAAMEKLGKLQLREGDTAFEGAMHEVAERLRSAVGS